MPTTTYHDKTFGVRAIGQRTNAAGSGVTDLSAEEDRFESADVTAGFVTPADSFEVTADTAWNVQVGSGGSKTDIYAVQGASAGQGTYIVRLDQAGDTVTISAADGSNPRKDEVYLVIEDNAYDSSGRALPRLAYREGTPAGSPSAPGPDGAWTAYVLLATIDVPAAAANIGACTITDERSASQLVVDAPTLQLFSSEDFSLVGHDHDERYADIAHVNSDDGHPVATGSSDGFMSGSDKTKLDGIESGAEVNDSASAMLILLLTVDGPGSGIDADTLDGLGSGSLALSTHTHTSRYYTEAETTALLANYAGVPDSVMAVRTSALAVSSGVTTDVTMTAEDHDDWDGWSGASTANIFADTAGYYLITGRVVYATSAAGNFRHVELYSSVDGVVALSRQVPVSGDSTVVNITAVRWLGASEAIRMRAYHDAGVALNVNPAFLRLTKL